jgi:Rod binding domain-containing protein
MTTTGSAQAQEFDKQLREVAALYEKELHRSMVRALKQTVPESGLINKNQAERIFEEQLFDQYAEMMADQGSGALRQVIYDNLKMRYLNK